MCIETKCGVPGATRIGLDNAWPDAGVSNTNGVQGQSAVSPTQPVPPADAQHAPASPGAAAVEGDVAPLVGEPERQRLVEAMETAGWVQAKAARLLEITPRQVGCALRKHGIDVKKF